MLEKNLIEQIESALKAAEKSNISELEERLNICKIIIGTYELSKNDLENFKNFTSDDFIDFYNRWFYRAPDKVVPNGSGIIFALCKIVETLDKFRNEKNITEEYADRIKSELDEKYKQLESWEAIKSEINEYESEKKILKEQSALFEHDIKKLDGIKLELDKYKSLNNSLTANESVEELKIELDKIKDEIKNKDISLNQIIEICKICKSIDFFNKLNLDLICEYIEDEDIINEIKNNDFHKTNFSREINEIKRYEAEIDNKLRDYIKLLKEVILKL